MTIMPSHIRFTNDKCEALYGYWRSLSKDGGMPRWADFDPLHIPRLLPNILVLETEPDDGFLIRLAGTECVDFYGRELRGQSLDSLVTEESRQELREHMRRVLEGPSAAVTLMQSPIEGMAGTGLSYTLEAAALPMAGEDGGIHRILAALFVIEAPPSAPPIGPDAGAWRRFIQERQYIGV